MLRAKPQPPDFQQNSYIPADLCMDKNHLDFLPNLKLEWICLRQQTICMFYSSKTQYPPFSSHHLSTRPGDGSLGQAMYKFIQAHIRSLKNIFKICIYSDFSLAQVSQKGGGIFFLGDLQKLSGYGPGNVLQNPAGYPV